MANCHRSGQHHFHWSLPSAEVSMQDSSNGLLRSSQAAHAVASRLICLLDCWISHVMEVYTELSIRFGPQGLGTSACQTIESPFQVEVAACGTIRQ